ncbi:C39 family peptidase [Rhodopirellula bahusiensis]|uniref:Peptidase C39 n=1 Tax=Rhodopirellula bahusiensis TaxID=2014065 RepID=A0A2G1W1R9_9BACT|nr:C39 family peptidase [Rhodopirellula bahusiensis]PHQ32973.1 peptidase C39 [Rhodopirellula bahusiensis]
MIAMLVMLSLSIAAGWIAYAVAYSEKGQRVMLCLSLAVLAMIYFLFYASGQLFWAKWVPDSAAIIYTNFASIFAALAAGWALRLPKTPAWRRGILAVLLGMGSAAAILWPLLSIAIRPAPDGGDQWKNGVAMQTSWATCSPAAAATLYRAEGIEVSESDLIPLCLTDSSGTPTLGLYRGIKLVADREGRSVEVLDETLDEMWSGNDWPVLLAVKLPYGVDDRRYADQWGWIPGMGHSVVALGLTSDGQRMLVGDPSVGLEQWSKDDLRVLWHGDGVRVR